jgi:SAM-dependent methyltransferase
MCNSECIRFVEKRLTESEIKGNRVLEVGAMDVNGSVRRLAVQHQPVAYVGVDIAPGPGVDEVCDVQNILRQYGHAAFGVVICTEVLEHVREWRTAISQLKHVLKPTGVLLLTTRSKGFPYHGYPHDFWRFECHDLEAIFGDLEIEAVERDPSSPGAFLKARKLADFVEKDLRPFELYSMIKGKRSRDIRTIDIVSFRVIWSIRRGLSSILPDPVKGGFRKCFQRTDQIRQRASIRIQNTGCKNERVQVKQTPVGKESDS